MSEFIKQQPIVLASKSRIRQQLLQSTGLHFDIQDARVDETSYKDQGYSPRQLAQILAEAKAKVVSEKWANSFIIGCDQTGECQQSQLNKPKSREKAIQQLSLMSGKPHLLHSGVSLFRNGLKLWTHTETVTLTMRKLSQQSIVNYVDEYQPLHSCGAYYFEGPGKLLFESISGDENAILGLPLHPLLNALFQYGTIELS